MLYAGAGRSLPGGRGGQPYPAHTKEKRRPGEKSLKGNCLIGYRWSIGLAYIHT